MFLSQVLSAKLRFPRGSNNGPGPYWLDRVSAPWGSPEMGHQLVEALNDECGDTLAALDWLRTHPDLDDERIGIVGSSFGGVLTVLAAGRSTKFKAGISFAGLSQTWPDAPALQECMIKEIGKTEVPIFLIQAQNDNHLTPTYVLGAELARLGKIQETRIYPPIDAAAAESWYLRNRRRTVGTRCSSISVSLDPSWLERNNSETRITRPLAATQFIGEAYRSATTGSVYQGSSLRLWWCHIEAARTRTALSGLGRPVEYLIVSLRSYTSYTGRTTTVAALMVKNIGEGF